jgi:spoIIIJ-associated protein
MRSVEVEGNSIDDAIRKALVELGVTRDRASIEILNDVTRGILGFGGKKARVKASVRAPLSEMLAALDERTSSRVSRETPKVETALGSRIRPLQTPARPAGPASSARSAPQPEARARVSRETKQPDRGLAPNVSKAPAPAHRPAAPVAPASVTQTAPSELATRSRAVLLELLSHLGVQCEVGFEPATEEAVVNLAVRGDSSALLIGKHGQTLDAIEYILNRIVVRESGSTARIEIDVEGYRARRAEGLISTARRMAEKVRETGRPATVDLMNPRDRRIVHMALKDEGGVTSRSQGDGFLRKLIILPAGKRRNGPRSARDGE